MTARLTDIDEVEWLVHVRKLYVALLAESLVVVVDSVII